MKWLIYALVMAAFFGSGSSCRCDVLLSWNTQNNLGTETSEPIFSHSENVLPSSLTLGSGVTPLENANRLGGSNWSLTLPDAITAADYLQFVVQPAEGFVFSSSSFEFIWDRSNTGPSSLALRSSLDGFSSNISVLSNLPTNNQAAFSIMDTSSVANVPSATTFRLYGFGGTNASQGTGGFDRTQSVVGPNVIFKGTVTAVPEPSSMLLALLSSIGVVLMSVRSIRVDAKARRGQRS